MPSSSKPPQDHKILRPHGPWVPAVATDIRKTFARARERMRKVVELRPRAAPPGLKLLGQTCCSGWPYHDAECLAELRDRFDSESV